MTPRSEHNEGREPVMRDVQQVLSALREGSRSNPDVLGIESYEVMRALNKGFPKHMYHLTLDPVVALDKQDETGLKELGYSPNYIPRQFPCWVHRRNFGPRFALQMDPITKMPQVDKHEFIESRIVHSQAELERLGRERPPLMPIGVPPPGPWQKLITDIPDIEVGSEEDQTLSLARLEGQLEEARRNVTKPSGPAAEAPKRRGRPPKQQEPVPVAN